MNFGYKQLLGVGLAVVLIGQIAVAHPMVEGGMKTGFVSVKDFAGTHLEFVADPGSNEVRIYVSEAEDEKRPDGKNWEWVVNMTVREKKIKAEGGETKAISVLPLRDPGTGNAKWFPAAPVEARDGYLFYHARVTARVMLDADPAKRHSVALKAGKGPNGRHCFKAPLQLSEAKTIRVEEVKFTVFDAAKKKEAWSKFFFKEAFGLGLLRMRKAKQVSTVDMPLQTYATAIADVQSADKFRKPEAP